MTTTDWDSYGTGNYEKCANCMVHCGYEPTAVDDTVRHPLRALMTKLRPIRTDGPMAPEISLANQRPAEFIFEQHVEDAMAKIESEKLAKDRTSDAA